MHPQQYGDFYAELNNGIRMPLLGLGVYDMYGLEAETAIHHALEIGYRLIDTATMYGNEVEVGNAIRQFSVSRNELFVTTKVNDVDQGYDQTLRAFEASQRMLNCGHIDLYLIHWPIKNKRLDTWRALERLYTDGLVRAIGVANYMIPFLDELLPITAIQPVVNQVEFSPYLFLQDLLARCQKEKIVLQAYTPLVRGERFNDLKLQGLAQKYGKTPAQIILRWALQLGISTIPKSINPKRLKENFDVFDFSISDEDMAFMATFNEGYRVVPDPMSIF
ncbi:aldo/keto reductase [Haliscomenobacter hydrossis]|uniref:Methylglyoxal reductase (NADPH-dependent) n=1 Tax=Haliscomenobacter hydrossis (strain ATCC 27775 / DSM 1100 / LMG 10767 / O) TaxID=760192 RepID=F4L4M8_HALH1|nr:aldo/keto reductase [Haliscomenobacter hydrossis]AEE52976.1 Methylglyoxal reductase (NADPH-dependent) [Haliscomenobacter hydrossis DSM 1100]